MSLLEGHRGLDGIEYRQSNPVSKDFELFNQGKCPTVFRARLSQHAAIADKASWDCQDDFIAAGYEDLVARFVGNFDDISGNFTALAYPEALPERLYITSYLIEYGFMYDGKISKLLVLTHHEAYQASDSAQSQIFKATRRITKK